MIGMTRWMPALAAGALAFGLAGAAMANDVAEYCQVSLKNDPMAKNLPDLGKFCGCIGEKVPASDRAATVTVMKASDDAKAKGGRLETSTLPPEQAKALDGLRAVVMGCMETAGPAQSAPPAAGKVTGMAAWSQLVNNTVAGKVDGKDYAEFYQPDGTVKTMHENELVTGKWALEGDKVCFVYPQEEKECFTVEVAGDDVTFTDTAGTGIRLKLLKGNPKNL